MKNGGLSLLGLLVAAIGLHVPGCASHDAVDYSSGFTTGVQQSDIPVPLNFRFDPNRGYDYQSYRTGVGSFRSWRGFYYGDHQVASLIPWYQQQMTVDGWTYRDTREEEGMRCLRFQKGDETASIWLYRDYDQRIDRYVSIVRAEIHPTPNEELSHEEAIQLTSGQVPGPAVSPLLPTPARVSARPGDAVPGARRSAPAARAPLASPQRPLAGRPPAAATAKPRQPAPVEADEAAAPVARHLPAGNKAVVNEEMGAENNEESRQEDEIAPEDGE